MNSFRAVAALVAIVPMLGFAAPAVADGFRSCAETPELSATLCEDAEFKRFDGFIAATTKSLPADLSAASAKRLGANDAAWRVARAACGGDRVCLKRSTALRFAILSKRDDQVKGLSEDKDFGMRWRAAREGAAAVLLYAAPGKAESTFASARRDCAKPSAPIKFSLFYGLDAAEGTVGTEVEVALMTRAETLIRKARIELGALGTAQLVFALAKGDPLWTELAEGAAVAYLVGEEEEPEALSLVGTREALAAFFSACAAD